MSRIVQKFGGTSVADLSRIRNAAGRVKQEVDAGNEIAVVVSAMAGTTDQLIEWTREMSRLHDAREYDVVVSAGEPTRSKPPRSSGDLPKARSPSSPDSRGSARAGASPPSGAADRIPRPLRWPPR